MQPCGPQDAAFHGDEATARPASSYRSRRRRASSAVQGMAGEALLLGHGLPRVASLTAGDWLGLADACLGIADRRGSRLGSRATPTGPAASPRRRHGLRPPLRSARPRSKPASTPSLRQSPPSMPEARSLGSTRHASTCAPRSRQRRQKRSLPMTCRLGASRSTPASNSVGKRRHDRRLSKLRDGAEVRREWHARSS